MRPKELFDLIQTKNVQMIDLKFMDFPGLWQHFSIPVDCLNERSLEEGFGFDGSSIRGWQGIHQSDMVMLPDVATAVLDPFMEVPTASLICNIIDPITRQPYSRDPRYIAIKAEKYLKSTGLADSAYFGPEAEFFIFDDIRFEQNEHQAFYCIDSAEGRWNSGREESPNLGYKPRYKEGYFPVAPTDSLQDLRTEMVLALKQVGIAVEAQHHEVATAGQSEIDMRYAPLLHMADQLVWFKYVVKNCARRRNKTVTFMPKPLFGDNGSGMHVHISLWKEGQPLFAGDGYAGLSAAALQFIAGILHHAPALCAIANPTTNSYKRLVPGFEAPTKLAYSSRNRSAAIRIPMYSADPRSKRIEFRTPDPSCNGYLAFSAVLMAGLDGIEKRMNPGEPLDKDIYNLPPEELAQVPSAPTSLKEALKALEKDCEFLMKGDVFTEDVIENWIRYKYEQEVVQIDLRPVPYEFSLYYDI